MNERRLLAYLLVLVVGTYALRFFKGEEVERFGNPPYRISDNRRVDLGSSWIDNITYEDLDRNSTVDLVTEKRCTTSGCTTYTYNIVDQTPNIMYKTGPNTFMINRYDFEGRRRQREWDTLRFGF